MPETDASYNDPIQHGGNWDPEHNWKKLRAKKEIHDKTGKWSPTEWDGGRTAGKGDHERRCRISKELYNLRYNLAFGNITREEYENKLDDLDK